MISSYFQLHKEFSKLPFPQVKKLLDEGQQKIEFMYEQHRAMIIDKVIANFEKHVISDESIHKFQLCYSDTYLYMRLHRITNQDIFRELFRCIGFLNSKGRQLLPSCLLSKLGGDDE
ncbi:MAG: hypothetical protein ACI9AT_000532 [Ulvibacter sp.]|jgi:hypothetical protein